MYKAIFLFLILLGLDEGGKKDIFTSPLEIPLTLSANFGELRPGHFHSGLDFKTNGVSGKRVLAVSDGYIYRISVGPGGFGNAIYIRHNNGYSTVYGHLDRFTPEIEDYVTAYQYRNKSFNVNIIPEKNAFIVKQGGQIGFSGNSGSSFGPHLHFEVRKSVNENPIDPSEFFDLADDIKPVINMVSLYPVGISTTIDNKKARSDYNLIGSKGRYRINSNKVIDVSGDFGLGVTTWDFYSDSWNKCGVKSIEVRLDSTTIYKHSVDEFSFNNTRFINSHIDFEEYSTSKKYIQKAFTSPNNKLSIYNEVINKGIIHLIDSQAHKIDVIVHDYAGNKSDLSFAVRKVHADTLNNEPAVEVNRIMPYEKSNEYIRHDIKLSFPEYSFYETLQFDYKKIPGDSNLLADIHFVHNNSVPVHKFYSLSIKPNLSDTALLRKACIVSVNSTGYLYIGGEYLDGFITARIRDFGTYSIGLDTIPPLIEALNFKTGGKLSGRNQLRLKIKDDFSGIADYEGTIDGEWALFEWDPKNNMVKYKFSKGSLQKEKDHELVLIVRDGRNNTTRYTSSFYW